MQELGNPPHDQLSDEEWSVAGTSASCSLGRLSCDWYIGHCPTAVAGELLSSTTSSAPYPRWVEGVIRQIREIVKLQEGWDSYGARRVSPEAVDSVVDLLFSIMRTDTPEPDIVPTAGGRAQIEWHMEGIDLEVEVLSTTRFFVSFEREQRPDQTWEGVLTTDLRRLSSLVLELSRRNAD